MELVSLFTLARMGAGADALESLGVLAKVYTTTEAFLGALEVAFVSTRWLLLAATATRDFRLWRSTDRL